MLYQIFNKAEANDLILKNPVRYADKTRSMDAGSRKEAFTADEVRLLMEKLPYDRMGLSIRLMLGTGMRSQELLGLEPRHIAEDGSVIQIRQATKKVKGSVAIGPPKSRDSYRDILVPPSLRGCALFLRCGQRFPPCETAGGSKEYFRWYIKRKSSEILRFRNFSWWR